jgi:hypothetical protein
MPYRKTYDPTSFDNADDPEVQYWAGFMMADGCVTNMAKGQSLIQIALNPTDRGHLVKFRDFLKSEHRIRDYGPRNKQWTDRGHSRISLVSDRLAASLARFGVVPRKTMTASSPLGSPSASFWRGVCDGDGHIRINSLVGQKDVARVQMLGSESLMGQFAGFVNDRIPGHDIKAFPFKSIWQVRLSSYIAFRTVQIMYGAGGTSLDRKQAKADEILSRPELCPPETFNSRWTKYSDQELTSIFEECGRDFKTMAERMGADRRKIHFLLTTTRGLVKKWRITRPRQKRVQAT